jgi:trimeric autotransporter adhesin
MPIKLVNGYIPLKERYRMYVINQHNFESLPRNGLVGEWLFSGNANDTSGNGYNGNVSGAVLAVDRKGLPNNAYEWDGTADWINVEFTEQVLRNLFATAFSISWWVKFDVTTTDRILIMFRNGGGPEGGLLIQKQNTGRIRVFIANGTNSYDKNDIDIGINTTSWFNLTLTAYHSSGRLYIDLYKNGVSILDTDVAYSLQDGTILSVNIDRIVFGALEVSGARIHDGKLDDIRMYNRVLTTDEITALYNE